MTALSSLTNRIFLASTLLATLSIGAGLFFISSRMRGQVEDDLQRDITEAANLVEQQRTTMFDNFTRTARLIADLPKFKAAVETGHPPTVEPIAADYQQQVGSDLFRVADANGRVLASIGELRAQAGGVLQLVSVPVAIGLDSPELLGTLTVGYLFDDERAALFKAQTGADIAFASGGKVRASTLGPGAHAALAALLPADPPGRVMIGDSEYAALVRPLPPPAGARPADADVPAMIVLRSRTERMHTLAEIQTGLIVVAALTVLLAVALSYGVARTITRPLARITDHMRQVADTGDLTRKIPVTGSPIWHDEDARVLATTFNTLTDSIATFQREAAQRERLSSLGRMSTIIAHEIRNPLMIIKGALRQITRDDAAPADIRDAAADIHGEIERLNRVVHEVLDFARPMRFERAPTDLNAVCRAAVAAVAAAEADPPVTTTLDPALPSIDTDGDKLRTVLVNLLTNARQAVLARNGDDTTHDRAVRLATARLGDRRVCITVSDDGIGVPPEDLPRIFDPFFTTRRTGTGLGLPIVRNIVDGLGGTVTVASTAGAGTNIRIELGDAPAPRA